MITLISNGVLQISWQIYVAERNFQTESIMKFPFLIKLPELSTFKSSVELTLLAFN